MTGGGLSLERRSVERQPFHRQICFGPSTHKLPVKRTRLMRQTTQ